MKRTIALCTLLVCLLAAAPALADDVRNENCVTVVDVPEQTIHHDAVTHEVTVVDVEAQAGFWANFAPNDTQGPFEGPPSYPVEAGGTWIVHTTGGPGQDQSGVFQIGNGHGDWFYRQQAVAEVSHVETVVDAEAYDEVIPPVTHQECDGDDGNPPPPPPVCTEDMPCFDCQTMGNQQCGPTPQPVVKRHVSKNDLPYTGQSGWLTAFEGLIGSLLVSAGIGGRMLAARRS